MKLKHLITNLKEFEVYQRYEGKKGQLQIVEFCNDIGIEVFVDNLGSGVSGKLVKLPNRSFEITINSRHNAREQIMAITRQLANYFRHKEYFETNDILEEVEYVD
jgi:hypothetical protein